jgi:predicted outer membrane repeat protein
VAAVVTHANPIAAVAKYSGSARAVKFSCAQAWRSGRRLIDEFVSIRLSLNFCKTRADPEPQMGTRMMGMRFFSIGVLLCAIVVRVGAAAITVINTNDSGPGSLRQALRDVHDGDTINFAITGTIGLISGGLPVTKNITISGRGSEQISIDGNQALLVFGIFPEKTAAISGLTIRNAGYGAWNQGTLRISNCVISGNSNVGLYNQGGFVTVSSSVLSANSYGLYSFEGVTTVSNCVVSGNSYGGLFNDVYHQPPNDPIGSPGSMIIAHSMISDNSGPGVSNIGGFLTVMDSTLSGNSAGQAVNGGGILSGTLFKTPADVTLINSTISGNSAPGFGGGIAGGYWGVTIVNSTISGNSAGDSGGGIAASFLTIMNSTISGNSAGNSGGGIAAGGPIMVTVANSTISGNSAGSGGGIYKYQGNLDISDTILNAGASGENIFNNGGTVTSHGYNVCSDDGGGYLNGPGDQINTDPLLGPLRNNGGPTLTHMPLPGSPVIDAGDPNFTPPPFHDQRGSCFHRVFGRRIDVGSVETQPQPRCVTPAPRPTPH